MKEITNTSNVQSTQSTGSVSKTEAGQTQGLVKYVLASQLHEAVQTQLETSSSSTLLSSTESSASASGVGYVAHEGPPPPPPLPNPYAEAFKDAINYATRLHNLLHAMRHTADHFKSRGEEVRRIFKEMKAQFQGSFLEGALRPYENQIGTEIHWSVFTTYGEPGLHADRALHEVDGLLRDLRIMQEDA